MFGEFIERYWPIFTLCVLGGGSIGCRIRYVRISECRSGAAD